MYGGGKESIKYSALTQIDTMNVKNLRVAWKYSTHDASPTNTSDMKTNGIVVDGIFYGLSPQLKIFALDAATGKEKWVYDPVYIPIKGANKGRGDFAFSTHISRGLTFYKGKEKDQRIFYAPGGGHLIYCLNALTGKVITSFGNDGKIDLHDDMGKDESNLHISMTSPGIIYKDLIIFGSRVSESAEAVPGHIRAYDVHTGKLRWIFHTIPQPGEPGFESWEDPEAYKYYGGANAWGGLSLDEKGEWYLPEPDLPRPISMEVRGRVLIYIQIAFWGWMQKPGSLNGIFRRFIMIFGIGIIRRSRYW